MYVSGRSRNVEGGGAHSVQACRNPCCSGTGTAKGNVWRCTVLIRPRKARKFFHLHFSVVWIGSCSIFMLYTALLNGRLSLSAVYTRTGRTTGTPYCHSCRSWVLIRLAGWTDHELTSYTALLQAVATACIWHRVNLLWFRSFMTMNSLCWGSTIKVVKDVWASESHRRNLESWMCTDYTALPVAGSTSRNRPNPYP